LFIGELSRFEVVSTPVQYDMGIANCGVS